jgi:hypothetical protein
MPFVKEVKIIEKTENTMITYNRLNLPLISDRDYVILIENLSEPKNNLYHLEWKEENIKGPKPKEGLIRIRFYGQS